MKKTLDIKKLILLNMPYILLGLFATIFGEAWRMAQGADASEKFLSLVAVLPGALQSFWPSLHPLDLLVGLPCNNMGCCGREKPPELTHVRANMKRREDGAVREVMKELLRSDLRFHKTDCGRFGAMTAWGLKDTSSRPAKDLGGTLRHTIRTMLRSYDSRASGDLLCSHRQGAWQM